MQPNFHGAPVTSNEVPLYCLFFYLNIKECFHIYSFLGEETKAKPVVVIVVVVVVVVVVAVVVGVAVYFFKRKPRRNEDAVLHPLKQQAIEVTS